MQHLKKILEKFGVLFSRNGKTYTASLKTRWILATATITIVFSFLAGGFFIKFTLDNYNIEFRRWALSLTQNLAFHMAPSTLVEDQVQLQNYLLGMMSGGELRYAVVLNSEQEILAICHPDWLFNDEIYSHSLAADSIRHYQSSKDDPIYQVVQPVFDIKEPINDERLLFARSSRHQAIGQVLTGDRLGTLVVGLSARDMHEKKDVLIKGTLWFTLVFMSTFIGICVLIANRITRPINSLVHATKRVAIGDLDQTVANGRKDELGLLAYSFNDMVGRLRRSQARLKEYTATLEQHVRERTRLLQESEQKYRTLFEQVGTAVCLLNLNKTIAMVNPQFEALTGLKTSDIENKHQLTDFFIDKDSERIDQVLDHVEKHKDFQIHHFDCTLKREANIFKSIHLSIKKVPESNYVLASLTDVSQLRELENQLNRTKQLAAIGEISASIAHEIRNPLGAIKTSVEILQNSLSLQSEDKELMNIICEESSRLDNIISDFLKFARLDKAQCKETDVNKLIRETLVLFKGTFGDKIKVKLGLDTVPKIYADANQLRQVMINMIVNATEAMPWGGVLAISSTTGLRHRWHDERMVIIRIQDNGLGIEKEQIKKIFHPFFSSKEKGGGMGLSICDRIVQNHRGEIAVTSRPGKGTVFTLYLPVQPMLVESDKEFKYA